MIDNPLITIYIPTYNRVKLLQRAVNSVLNQTYKNIEIIIVDDCSIDGTHEYLRNISAIETRIRYFIKETNSGACVSRNIAIKNAKGEFITGLDDDDYFENNRLELFLNKWSKKSEDTKVLYSLYTKKTQQGLVDLSKIRRREGEKIVSDDLLYSFYTGNQIFTTTDLLIDNLFDPKMAAWQDFECFYRLLKQNNCYAELVNQKTYIFDVSHDHERISLKKIEKIESAFQTFRDKHNLSAKHSNLLYCHLRNYPGNRVNKLNLLKRFMYKPSLSEMREVIKRKFFI